MADKTRCGWAKGDLDILYHDTEWGVPVHDDRVLFEFLTLEGAQAGLENTDFQHHAFLAGGDDMIADPERSQHDQHHA